MKPIIIFKNTDSTILFKEEDLKELLNEVYEQGVADGRIQEKALKK